MRAVAITEFGGPDKLRAMDLPRPKPGRGEILLRVVASGVSPMDWKIREGLLAGAFPHHFPLVPGWDAAGVVEELGEGTSRWRKGDRVWAYTRRPEIQWGTYAEFVTVLERNASLMPARLLFEEAAAVPMAGLTAWQALIGKAGVAAGATVLVHGAAGGVGHVAVQLARDAGATVFGTAGSANQEFVLAQGAAAALDYTREDFREALRRHRSEGVDVVLDTVGGEVLARSWEIVKPGGCLVSLCERPDPAEAARRGVRGEYVLAEPDGEQLRRLASLVERGRLKPHVQTIHPLAEAAAAQDEVRAGHVRGKLVLAL